MVGCGNSSKDKFKYEYRFVIELSEEMYKDGFKNITNMDISSCILDKMQTVYHPTKCPEFECINLLFIYIDLLIVIPMDATKMNFRSNSFDFCIDKGTYDALAVNNNIINIIYCIVWSKLKYLESISLRND